MAGRLLKIGDFRNTFFRKVQQCYSNYYQTFCRQNLYAIFDDRICKNSMRKSPAYRVTTLYKYMQPARNPTSNVLLLSWQSSKSARLEMRRF